MHDGALGLAGLGHDVLVLLAARPGEAEDDCRVFQSVSLGNTWFRFERAVARLAGTCEGLRYFWSGACKPLRAAMLEQRVGNIFATKAGAFAPDVVVAEDIYIARLAIGIAGRVRAPLCYRAHHVHWIQHGRQPGLARVLRRWETRILDACDTVIGFTPEDVAYLAEHCSQPIVRSPFGLAKHAPEGRIAMALRGKRYALYVSSYVGEEDATLRRLAQACQPDGVAIVGEGCRDFVNAPGNCLLLGYLSTSALAGLYSRCGFAFFPLRWRPGQGFPTKLADAYLNGAPILMRRDSSHLLPRAADGVYCYNDEDEMCFLARQLLRAERHVIHRGDMPFDVSETSQGLAKELQSVIARSRKKHV